MLHLANLNNLITLAEEIVQGSYDASLAPLKLL